MLGVIGMGFHSMLGVHFVLTIEGRIGASIIDINHEDYHLENQKYIYGPSRNMYGEIHIGLGLKVGNDLEVSLEDKNI